MSLCISRNLHRVNRSLQVVGEEVTRQTSFKTFFMWGGPSTMLGSVDLTVYVHSFNLVSRYLNIH